MKLDKYKIYDLVYNFHVPIVFFLFIGSMIITGITGNVLYFAIGTITAIFLSLYSIFYLYIDFSTIKRWWKSLFKYKLTTEEVILWNSIQQKATHGYSEFCEECKKDPNYWSWPWMSPNLTVEERALVDKIHEYFYPGDYIVDPLGVAQCDWAFFNDIKDKVK